MVRNDDDQSFVPLLSIAELLHPETAASNITRRHQDESPWATVYYEAVSGPVDYENMPMAVDVVAIQDDVEEANPQQPQDVQSPGQQNNVVGRSQVHPRTTRPMPKPQPWQHSNVVDLILGFAFSLSAFICTIKIELTAIIIYTMAAGFHYLAEEVFSATPAMLGRSICLLLCTIFMVVDPILLTVSVLVTELLGGVALLLCSVFGGPRSGIAWHQFIRKTCHLTRWGFRNCHKGWKPERIFPISMEDERFQLSVVPCEEPENETGVECTDSSSYNQSHRYSDSLPSRCTCCGSQQRTNCTCTTDESTMISEVTFLENQADIECPPIAIAPENVSVVPETTDVPGEPLFKNNQVVTMT